MYFPDALISPLLRVTRRNRAFLSVTAAQRVVRQRQVRPAAYGPPRRLREDVRIEVTRNPWPVYTVTPGSTTPAETVVYVHGGGWVNEIHPLHWQLVAQIAVEAHATVVVPIYPLIPFSQASEVNEFIVGLARSSAGPTVIAGDSAGGQIALSAALTCRDAHGLNVPTALISPALDLTFTNPLIPEVQPHDPWLAVPGARHFVELWRGDLDVLDPRVSPLAGDLTWLGPITLMSGTRDILNPDAHLLAERARAAGVPVDFHEAAGQVHVYPLLPTRTAATARSTLIASLRRYLGHDDPAPTGSN